MKPLVTTKRSWLNKLKKYLKKQRMKNYKQLVSHGGQWNEVYNAAASNRPEWTLQLIEKDKEWKHNFKNGR